MEKKEEKSQELPAGVSQNGKNIPPLGFWGKVGRLCVRAISHLPLRVLYLGADLTYFILYRVLGFRSCSSRITISSLGVTSSSITSISHMK